MTRDDHRPPRLAERLLSWRLPASIAEAVLGDLREDFAWRRAHDGPLRANLWFWYETLAFARLARRGAHPSGPCVVATRGASPMRSIPADVRFACRLLRKSPAFTAIALLTLALGIGANTAVFSVVNATVLHPVRYPDADGLLVLRDLQGSALQTNADFPEFRSWREHAADVADVGAVFNTDYTVGGADPELMMAQRVSTNLFPLLGVSPVIGRPFQADEEGRTAPPVAAIGYALWQRRFAGSADAVGKTIVLEDVPYTIVAVMPAWFSGVLPRDWTSARPREIWVPLRVDEQNAPRGLHFISVLGRLRSGVTLDQARQRLAAMTAALARDNQGHAMVVHDLSSYVASTSKTTLLALSAAVGAVLLIACANLANLLLARGTARRREIAVRLAVGASRLRVLRQFLIEGVLLAAAGGALGLAIALAAVRWFASFDTVSGVNPSTVRIDAWVLVFTAAVSVATGILFTLAPAISATRTSVPRALAQTTRPMEGRGTAALRSLLVVGEIALAVVLLASASLLGRSFAQLLSVDKGFDSRGVLTFDVTASRKNTTGARASGFFDDVLGRLAALPGVQAASLVNELPLGGGDVTGGTPIEGRTPAQGPTPVAKKRIVGPDYFAALSVPVRRGRAFAATDRAGVPPVAIVSEAFVRKYFPGIDPIGRRVAFSWDMDGWQQVVGVVGDLHDDGLDVPPEPTVYVTYLQRPDTTFTFVVRGAAAVSAESIVAAVHAVDPTRPVRSVRSLDTVIGSAVAPRRLALSLMAAFAGLALTLASLGVYGVISYAVQRRTREFGVRIALGAPHAAVMRLVLRQGVTLTICGLLCGTLMTAAVRPVLSTYLFGVSAADPLALAGTCVVLAAIALAGCYVPARRAIRIDPVVALRVE